MTIIIMVIIKIRQNDSLFPVHSQLRVYVKSHATDKTGRLKN